MKTLPKISATKVNCLAIQDLVLRQTLLMLHPFIPFITEELWHQLGYGAEGAFIEDVRLANASQIATTSVARGLRLDHVAVRKVELFKELVTAIRQLKASHGLANRKDVEVYIPLGRLPVEYDLKDLQRYLGLAKVEKFTQGTQPGPDSAPATVTPFGTAYLVVQSALDVGAEKIRLTKELDQITKHIAGTEARLSNEAFVSKAPPAVLEGARKQLAEQKAKHAELGRLLKALG